MNGWYSKAINVFKPEVPDQPQMFVLFCSCGEEHRGLRSEQHQQVDCAVCGNRLFVLPRDVYPVAPPRSGKKKAAAQTRSEATPDERLSSEAIPLLVEQVEEVAEGDHLNDETDVPSESEPHDALPSLSALRDRIKNAGKPKQVQVAEAVPKKAAVRKDVRESILPVLKASWEDFQRFWSPFRILIACVIMVLIATGGWMWRQAALTQAAQIVLTEGPLGLEALERDDWLAAHPHLQRASAALALLGRTDPEAQTIRQYARETEAQFRLCEVSLMELVDAARKELDARGSKNRKKGGLAPLYYGDWLIIEGVVADSTPKKSRRRQHTMRIPLGNEQVLVECNFPLFATLIPKGASRAVILAGTISDISRTEEGDWKLTMSPDSGFLWTHLKTYRSLGFEFNPFRTEESVEKELNEQARVMGVPE